MELVQPGLDQRTVIQEVFNNGGLTFLIEIRG
jgi:hypothetical protein